MAKLTLSEAARACNVARTTIQRAVKTGRLSLDAEHRIDTAELLRVGYQLDAAVLHAASQQSPMQTQQNAAPQRSTTQQQGVAAQEIPLLRQERDALQRERDLLMQQVDMLRSMHQTTQQQLTHAQQMLHEMQHRYDRLLAAPNSSQPVRPELSSHPEPRTAPSTMDPRGDTRRRIVALLREYPEGLTPAEIRGFLGVDRPLSDTLLGMRRYGLVQRVGRGRYVAAPL
jgi:hypothetical protein